MRFRSEIPFGAGIRDLKVIMVYETYELGNLDILETLLPKIQRLNPRLAVKLHLLIKNYETGRGVKESITSNIFGEVIDTLNIAKKKNFRYGLWLSEYKVVRDYYGQGYSLTRDKIDAYEESDIIISELGVTGALYAYETLPVQVAYGDVDIEQSNRRLACVMGLNCK